jgi:hypothetical protein
VEYDLGLDPRSKGKKLLHRALLEAGHDGTQLHRKWKWEDHSPRPALGKNIILFEK